MLKVTSQQALQTARQYHQAGQFQHAEALYRQVLEREPGQSHAWYLLGVLNHQTGNAAAAVDLLQRAIAIQPAALDYHCALAMALRDSGQLAEAIVAFRHAAALNPEAPQVRNYLGSALAEKGDLEEAIAQFRKAAALKPDVPEALANLGSALMNNHQPQEALIACRQALAVRPNFPEAYQTLALALVDLDRLDDAIAAFGRAVALRPQFAEALTNLGNALLCRGLTEQGIAAHRQAVAAAPDFPMAQWNLSLALLLNGNFAEGLKLYEWRWECTMAQHQRKFSQPIWDGSDLGGRTILLYAEQGFGDTFQFIRYVPLVLQRGGRIILECHPELTALLAHVAGVKPVIAGPKPPEELPACDVQCPLLSLPLVLGTTVDTIPAAVPYLAADAQRAAQWAARVSQDRGLKIGLAWAGRPTHNNDRQRSLPLAALSLLAGVPDVAFYTLQKGAAAAEAQSPPPGMKLMDVSADLHDFADTAALIANLDLVISIDSAVAHLAGAMGKPVWTLLPFAPDWRWLLKRSDTPWYPTMRLFRQPKRGDWNSVMQQVGTALAAWRQSGLSPRGV